MRGAGAVLSILLLVGCASNETKPGDESDNKGAATAAAGQAGNEPAPAPARPVPPPKPSVEIANPTVITFEKMSVALDGKARDTIAELADKARSSNKLLVTGYCDRNQIKNATDSAVARAIAVRDELMRHGVNPANISVKFSTVKPKKHAAEIKFD